MYDFDEKPDLNITPLVDVMLVLLAILMVTAPTMVYEEYIQLPKGSKTKTIAKSNSIEIRVNEKKEILIKKEKFSYSNFPDRFLLFAQDYDKKTKIIITADERLNYGDIVFVLKSVKNAGFFQVSLATNG